MTKLEYFATRFLGLRGSWKWAKARMNEGYTVCVKAFNAETIQLFKMDKGIIYYGSIDSDNSKWHMVKYEPITFEWYFKKQIHYKIYQ